jgi:hypothetical protein
MSKELDEAGADKQKSAVCVYEDKHGHFEDKVIGKTLVSGGKNVDNKKPFSATHSRGAK